jgi:hypothetical protein
MDLAPGSCCLQGKPEDAACIIGHNATVARSERKRSDLVGRNFDG